jgi:hypothetical protein
MTTQFKIILAAILLIAVALSAYLFGVHTSRPGVENIAPAAAQSQPDGSVILAREPVASAPAAAKPKAKIPKGATLERQIRVTVKPRASLKIPATQSAPAGTQACPPVTVDLSLVRDGDGRRVVASSPDGDVVGGIDVPVEAGIIPVSHPWAAGVSCNAGQSCALRGTGAWVERDLGRIRVGAEAFKQTDGHLQGRVRVGWVW